MRDRDGSDVTLVRRGISSLDPLLGRLFLLVQRRRREGVIALYHRVAPEPNHLYRPLHPYEFERHCVVLKRSFNVIPLSELLERHRMGKSLAGCCSISFDDGYLDFRDHALPVLEAHDLPAAQFVITDCLETGRAPWNLRLRGIVLRSGKFDASDERLFARLNAMAPRERESWLDEREGELGPPNPLYEPPKMLRVSDLAEIGSRRVELGSHTVSHRNLAETDARAAQQELTASRQRLAELGQQVSVVAYPNNSFSRATMEAARDAGYDAGLTADNRAIAPGSNPFALPRFDVTDRPVGMLRMELGGAVQSLRWLRGRFRGGRPDLTFESTSA